MSADPLLFPTPRRPKAKPRRLMRLCDAGEPGLHMRCHRCGHDGGWWSDNADRLGVPCPICDGSETPAGVVLQMAEYCRCDACRPHCAHPDTGAHRPTYRHRLPRWLRDFPSKP